MSEFRLPDVGEGLTEAEIISWKVEPGDSVAVNDILVEIETAKSLVELPSPFAGTVEKLLVSEGEIIAVGTPIIWVGSGSPDSSTSADPSGGPRGEQPLPGGGAPLGEVGTQLVGTGPRPDTAQRRRRRIRPASPSADGASPAVVSSHGDALAGVVKASPLVRKLAKDRGVNLEAVTATGKWGQMTREDVLAASPAGSKIGATGAQDTRDGRGGSVNDGEQGVERIPVRGVRKATAEAVSASAFSAPHVSVFVDVDASRTMEFVKRLKTSQDFEGVKVSPLLILAKAVLWAVERNPLVNAEWAEQEILVKKYVNLGIAASTPRGLLVPNIKSAQALTLRELALALNELAATARSGRTTPAGLRGGTITITNIGALGIDTGTPIIPPGEVAIVAFGTIKHKPWVLDGEVIPRWITTLGGSFDHRVVDGDLSARFLADVASILEEPALLLE